MSLWINWDVVSVPEHTNRLAFEWLSSGPSQSLILLLIMLPFFQDLERGVSCHVLRCTSIIYKFFTYSMLYAANC